MTNKRTIIALTLAFAAFAAPALAQEHSHEAPTPPAVKWSFAGPFGKFDEGHKHHKGRKD